MNKQSITWLLAAAIACAPCFVAPANAQTPRNKSDAAGAWSENGLEKIQVKGLDLVYAKPGSSLAGYTKVLLRPIDVTFRRNWEKQSAPGSRIPIGAKDSQRIKDRLSALVREEVSKELAAGGYQIADAPGDDVLDVKMSIVDLNVAAPDLQSAGRVTTFAVSAGEMTLVAELRDSATGDIVMRVFDRSLAHESYRAQRITSVDNAAEARSAAIGWAKALRNELDLARGSKP
jgi:hypothetical protein